MEKKRVVITGGSGFLGSHVVEVLQQRKWCTEAVVPRSRNYEGAPINGIEDNFCFTIKIIV